MADEEKKYYPSGTQFEWETAKPVVPPERMQKVVNQASEGLVSKLAGTWGAGAKSVAAGAGEVVSMLEPGTEQVGRDVEKVRGGIQRFAGGAGVPGTWGEGGEYRPVPIQTPRAQGAIEAMSVTGGGGIIPSTAPTTGGPLEASKVTPVFHVNEQGVVTPGPTPITEEMRGPMKPTVSTFDKGAGYTPGGSEVVPTGGGYQGFVDSEMAKIQKDRAEYDEYLKKREEESLAGLGPEGEERMRKRIAALSPYLEGVSKGRAAKIMGGFMGELMKSEDEARKALVTSRGTREAAETSATIKAGATRQAAIMKAQSEAQKLGIDVAKLGLEQQKLGIEGAKADASIKESMARVQDLLHKNQMWEPMKLQLQASKDATERKKIQMEFAQNAIKTDYQEKMKAWNTKVKLTGVMTPELQAEGQKIAQDFAKGDAILSFLNPQEGQRDPFTGKNVFKGGKWTETGEEE